MIRQAPVWFHEVVIFNEFTFSCFSLRPSRIDMTVSRATARACPSSVPCLTRGPTPARRRCLTRPRRTSSLRTSRRRTSHSLTTRARTRTRTSATRTPWTPCTRANRAHGGPGSGKTSLETGWTVRLCWRSRGRRCHSCPGWSRGETTAACGGPTCCCTRLTLGWSPSWVTAYCRGCTVWRTCRWVADGCIPLLFFVFRFVCIFFFGYKNTILTEIKSTWLLL